MKKTTKVFVGFSLLGVLTMFPLSAQPDNPDSINLACAEGQCDGDILSLHKLARYGNYEAMTLLSMVYATGDGREADHEKALNYLERAVKNRSPMAVFLMSEWYREGFVVAQDLQQAAKFLAEAVKLNHPPAQYRKALQLLQQPDTANVTEAITLLEQASDKRLVDAMFLLARMKMNGAFVETDLEGAAQLYKKLVLSGHDQSRPYLRETIAMLAAEPGKSALVADLQQSYDVEVIRVIDRDFNATSLLSNAISQMNRTGIYSRGSMNKFPAATCDVTNTCLSFRPQPGEKSLRQVLTGQK
ncbi:tetratricopeptide repeat protein [Arsukibacterium sp.]|uniref:tetratricopeptide repeat protein n=1 Tax=Arsukibacterium sp. TaxID=1977258 RepID=UPI001BD6517A|nr:tetratricopeptide repeat protein [Arsukibacterium sp.]